MEILVYSQQGNMGGSTRLLLAQFPDLRPISGVPETMRRRRFDVAVIHLPLIPGAIQAASGA